MSLVKKQNLEKEEEGSINNIISTIPKALTINDYTKKVGKYYLPFSIGIEIECIQNVDFDIEAFKTIPNILAVNCDFDEQRFRIPKGIKGLICLYDICTMLKVNSLLNPLSGIHYHVDCSSFFDYLDLDWLKKENWILDELDTWEYKGTYNKREIKNGKFAWVGRRSCFKTLEFRIGEMTFDYSLMFKRIVHLCRIVETIQEKALYSKYVKDNPLVLYESKDIEVKKVINNRKHFI